MQYRRPPGGPVRKLRPAPLSTTAQQYLDLFSRFGGRRFVYSGRTFLTMDEPEAPHPRQRGTMAITNLAPARPNKVTAADSETLIGAGNLILRGHTLWPLTLFVIVTGGAFSEFSRDSGVCVHRDPRARRNWVVTFMASWDHTPYGTGLVWPLPRRYYPFRSVSPEMPWLLQAHEEMTLPDALAFRVGGQDLFGRPVRARPDETLLGMGYEHHGVWSEADPLRGPHEPFDPRYACGATGGHLYVTHKGRVFLIGDFGS